MIDNSLHDEDAGMDEYLQRAIQRGTQIRRRRLLAQATAAIVAVCAVVIPLSVVTNNSPTPQAVNSSAFQLVSWSHVAYPGLNVSDARYPAQMGCGPGFPASFPVHVQQVTYVHPRGTRRTEALVLVKCESATPTPSSLYAFAPGTSTTPRLLQVVLAPPDPRTDVLWYADQFRVVGNMVSMAAREVKGSAAVCCPSGSTTLRWKIEGDRFVNENHPDPLSTNRG
jgi:hypothetical protein